MISVKQITYLVRLIGAQAGIIPLWSVRIDEESRKSENDENDTANDGDSPYGYSLRDETTSENGHSSADRVADDPAQGDAVDVLAGGQDDRRKLRAIPPFRQERQSECLNDDPGNSQKQHLKRILE